LDALLGQVVYSKAGRDSGRKFVVVKVIDEIYVFQRPTMGMYACTSTQENLCSASSTSVILPV
jgi:hypothetical protein